MPAIATTGILLGLCGPAWAGAPRLPLTWTEYHGRTSTVRVLRHGRPETFLRHRDDVGFSSDGRLMLSSDDEAVHRCRVFLGEVGTKWQRVLRHGCSGTYTWGYEWAPKGDRFLLERYPTDSSSTTRWVTVVDPWAGTTRRLGRFDVISWSPDGRRLLAFRGQHASVLDTATGRRRNLGVADRGVWSPGGWLVLLVEYENPRTSIFTRSGRRISRLRGSDFEWGYRSGLLTQFYSDERSDAFGFRVTDLHGRQRWSVPNAGWPGGTWGHMAYTVGDDVVVSRWDGRGRRSLGPSSLSNYDYVWSPTGRELVLYDTYEDDGPTADIASLSGRGWRQLPGSDFAWFPRGRRLVTYDEDGTRMWLAGPAGQDPRRIPGVPARGATISFVSWPQPSY
jgi:hypothetical protein